MKLRGEDMLLGLWYKTIKSNGSLEIRLSKDNIRRLAELDFDWKAKLVPMKYVSFDLHSEELTASEAKHGHCNAK